MGPESLSQTKLPPVTPPRADAPRVPERRYGSARVGCGVCKTWGHYQWLRLGVGVGVACGLAVQ
jgi:hypothetical protein